MFFSSSSAAFVSASMLFIDKPSAAYSPQTTFTQQIAAQYQAWRNEETAPLTLSQCGALKPVPANEFSRSTAMELVDHRAPRISTLLRAVNKGKKDKASYKKAREMYRAINDTIKRMLEQHEPFNSDFMPPPYAAPAASLQTGHSPVASQPTLGIQQASNTLPSLIGYTG